MKTEVTTKRSMDVDEYQLRLDMVAAAFGVVKQDITLLAELSEVCSAIVYKKEVKDGLKHDADVKAHYEDILDGIKVKYNHAFLKTI